MDCQWAWGNGRARRAPFDLADLSVCVAKFAHEERSLDSLNNLRPSPGRENARVGMTRALESDGAAEVKARRWLAALRLAALDQDGDPNRIAAARGRRFAPILFVAAKAATYKAACRPPKVLRKINQAMTRSGEPLVFCAARPEGTSAAGRGVSRRGYLLEM